MVALTDYLAAEAGAKEDFWLTEGCEASSSITNDDGIKFRLQSPVSSLEQVSIS